MNGMNNMLLFMVANQCFQHNITVKWPLYPKCVPTISGLFQLKMIEKDSVPAKVAIISEWPRCPWPVYRKSTV